LEEVDGALKVNLKSLMNKLERKSVETLKGAIQSEEKLLQKLTNIIKNVKEEDPKMCSKIDFLAESERMFEELTIFKEGIDKGLQEFETREDFISNLISRLSKHDDSIY
jgi:hypothetical protein